MILIGAFLLTLPVATENGNGLSFLNALFTATSATCVTGLVVVDTGTHLPNLEKCHFITHSSRGIRIYDIWTFFFFLLGKRISLKERLLFQEALNNISISGIVRLVKRILIFTFIIEVIGAFILSFRFSFDMPIGRAIYYGIFHAISNFNNAGFDLMGEFRSLTPYVEDPAVILTVCTLIILGGLGFIVMNEMFEYHDTKRLSMHSKVVLSSSFILAFSATILIFLFEFGNNKTLQNLSCPGKILSSLFQSVTPRTAGANTLNIADLTQSTIFLIIFLMFIGAAPGSTAGGIKITTFATLLGTVWSEIKGKEDVVFFHKIVLF